MEEIAEAVMRGLAGSTSPGIVSTLQMRSFVPEHDYEVSECGVQWRVRLE